MKSDSLKALLREVDGHPGIRHRIERGRRHSRFVIEAGGRSRFVTFTETRTDYRGILNKVAELRKLIRSLSDECSSEN